MDHPHTRPQLDPAEYDRWLPSERERFEERAAILEFCANLPRAEAEREALYLAYWHAELPPAAYGLTPEAHQAWLNEHPISHKPLPTLAMHASVKPS